MYGFSELIARTKALVLRENMDWFEKRRAYESFEAHVAGSRSKITTDLQLATDALYFTDGNVRLAKDIVKLAIALHGMRISAATWREAAANHTDKR